MIKISVVIPAKNRAKTLLKCLESIINQTYPVSEIIVVDDHSVDNTQEVLKSICDKRVIYELLPKGKGAQAARNYGIAIAKYEWIAFQDSDDLWLPEKLAIQVEVLSIHNYDKSILVHSNGLLRNTTTNIEKKIIVPLTEGKCYEQLLIQPGPMFQSFLVSKEMILKAGGLDDNCPSFQEWDTSIRLSKITKFIHIKQPLFVWIWHDGETISKDIRRHVIGYNYVINKNKKEIIARHGVRVWRVLKIKNISVALNAGLWSEVENLLDDNLRS